MKSKSFSLIEILIGMSLFIILLTALFGFLSTSMTSQGVFCKRQLEQEKLRVAQERLQRIVSKAIIKKNLDNKTKDSKKKYYFFTDSGSKSQSLVLTFNNGVDDPLFANEILGKIFLDDSGKLCIATWPCPETNTPISANTPWRKEVLLENVEDMKMYFYVSSPPPKKTKKEPDPVDPLENTWVDFWEKDNDKAKLPLFVRFDIGFKNTQKDSENTLKWVSFYVLVQSQVGLIPYR